MLSNTAAVTTSPSPRPKPAAAIEPTTVLRSFNTWAFKREQPSEPERLLQHIGRNIRRQSPIAFVLYWGKGPRMTVAAPERACLAYLDSLGQRIAAVYPPGAHFTLCLTDTHARLNGHREATIERYFDEVGEAASAFGMETVRLSTLVEQLNGQSPAAASCPDTILDDLERCAAKWFRGGGDPREGARRYLSMNMIESLAAETHLPDSIFMTFNGSAYRPMFPQSLPVFYMYSMRKGMSVKPWFLDADGRPFESASASAA